MIFRKLFLSLNTIREEEARLANPGVGSPLEEEGSRSPWREDGDRKALRVGAGLLRRWLQHLQAPERILVKPSLQDNDRI